MERGIAQGMQRGFRQKEKEIAMKMLQAGKPEKEILEFLSMSNEQLEELRKEVNGDEK